MRKAYNLFLHLPPRCFSCFAISPSAAWTMFSEQVGFHFFPFSFEILVTFMELSDPITYVTMQECGADLLIFPLFSIFFFLFFIIFFSHSSRCFSALSICSARRITFRYDRWLDGWENMDFVVILIWSSNIIFIMINDLTIDENIDLVVIWI